MKTTGLQAMFSRNLSGDRFRPTFVRFEVNPDQPCWDLKARGIHWNQEEMLTLTTEENDPKNTERPWFLNRQLLTGFGTLLTKKGPYLEVHHLHRLSDGGPDHPGALEQRSPAGGAGSQNDTAGALGYPLVQFSPDLEG